jgi:hydroxymethylglutaryl-CoA lyase
MAKLLEARKLLAEGLPGEPVYGYIPDAGLPKNFRRAAELA